MEGDVAECILDTAKTMSADCIVMGHQSRSWLNSIGMQNAAEKVLHESDIPVFIIPIHKMQPDTANQQEKTWTKNVVYNPADFLVSIKPARKQPQDKELTW